MKKLILLFCIGFCSFQISAQEVMNSATNAGSILLTGSSSLEISFADETPMFLGVGLGYFVIDNLAVGANFNYIRIFGESDTAAELFARYYALDNLFVGASYTMQEPKVFAAQVGYDWFIADRVAIEPVFEYPFKDGLDPAIGIGVSVFLR
jgi:hypothetical protein